jgi:hypothetical protein
MLAFLRALTARPDPTSFPILSEDILLPPDFPAPFVKAQLGKFLSTFGVVFALLIIFVLTLKFIPHFHESFFDYFY